MITQKQLRIFEIFARHPFAEHSRKQIKTESKEKSNNFLALTINSLKKERVLFEKNVGNSGILMLNLNNDLTMHYIALCNNQRINKPTWDAVNMLKNEITNETCFFSIAIFGSYAMNEQKATSDLDIAVFIENENKRKMVEALVNSAKLKMDIDAYIIPKDEMVEMLTNDEENLGKQIARKHIVVYNHHIFYEIIKQGMKRGFRV